MAYSAAEKQREHILARVERNLTYLWLNVRPSPRLRLPLTPEVQGDDLNVNKSAAEACSISDTEKQRRSIQESGGSLNIREAGF